MSIAIRIRPFAALFITAAVFGACAWQQIRIQPDARTSYIVQGASTATVAAIVEQHGGKITHALDVIRSVAADLTDAQAETLRDDERVTRLYGNHAVEGASGPGGPGGPGGGGGSPAVDTFYPTMIGADLLHQQGIDGWAIGIAVIDTGLWSDLGLTTDRYGMLRRKVAYDAITDTVTTFKNTNGSDVYDSSGHGSHVASIAASSRELNGVYNGIAPGARLIPVTALDENGQGTYADVIRGINWLVDNRNKHGIDVLNMSLSAPARSAYWEDPLNQAVMAAWQAGIVVVASAGNTGPDPQSIGVPGNVPYVITVGAMTDAYTPTDGSDDYLARFSAAGPTYEGFVKPELVAPGGHMVGLMQKSANLAVQHSIYHDTSKYFTMSGTSQAAAVVSGVAALALQMEPGLTPDQVKCKIMSAARPAVRPDGTLAYSIFQQGAGLVHAYDAVYNWNYDCANNGLDIAADLDGTKHFGGRANQNPDGSYYVMGLDGYLWTGPGIGTDGYLWSGQYTWTDGYLWSDGYLWTDGSIGIDGYLWSGGLGIDGYLWTGNLTEAMAINVWVEQE